MTHKITYQQPVTAFIRKLYEIGRISTQSSGPGGDGGDGTSGNPPVPGDTSGNPPQDQIFSDSGSLNTDCQNVLLFPYDTWPLNITSVNSSDPSVTVVITPTPGAQLRVYDQANNQIPSGCVNGTAPGNATVEFNASVQTYQILIIGSTGSSYSLSVTTKNQISGDLSESSENCVSVLLLPLTC